MYFKLKEWIPVDMLNARALCQNPHPGIVSILEDIDTSQYDWTALSGNPHAIPVLEKHIDKVDWTALSGNPNALSILEKHIDKVDWKILSGNLNTRAMTMIEKLLGASSDIDRDTLFRNKKKVDWYTLLRNEKVSKVIVDLAEDFGFVEGIENYASVPNQYIVDKVESLFEVLEDEPELSKEEAYETVYQIFSNPLAMHFIEKAIKNDIEYVDWEQLSMNPNTIHILENNIDKINWKKLISNPNGLQLIERHRDKIDWNRGRWNNLFLHKRNVNHLVAKYIPYRTELLFETRMNTYPYIVELIGLIPFESIPIHTWKEICENPYAIDYLKHNKDRIDWESFSKNPNIFDIAYDFYFGISIREHVLPAKYVPCVNATEGDPITLETYDETKYFTMVMPNGTAYCMGISWITFMEQEENVFYDWVRTDPNRAIDERTGLGGKPGTNKFRKVTVNGYNIYIKDRSFQRMKRMIELINNSYSLIFMLENEEKIRLGTRFSVNVIGASHGQFEELTYDVGQIFMNTAKYTSEKIFRSYK